MTTLVGVNESGKTNILKALWKFNPVSEGKIDILHDIPVTKLSEFRNKIEQIKFISVKFDICNEDVRRLEELSDNTIKGLEYVIVSRYYNGKYGVEFSEQTQIDAIEDEEENEKEYVSVQTAILNIMPKFVYYSNYGNLSSKIYLPHALRWIKGEKGSRN